MLEVAFEAGVRHFDTAPVYGYGVAEGLLGEFLRGKRDEVTVVTKFGIEPAPRSALREVARVGARAVLRLAPGLRSAVAQRAGKQVVHGNFDPGYAGRSLERSLAALGTSTIDVLLMHEVSGEQITPELIAFLQQVKAEGKIRSYGVGTCREEATAIDSGAVGGRMVFQFPEDAAAPALRLRGAEQRMVHSVFGRTFREFAERCGQDRGVRERSSKALGVHCGDGSELGRLFLFAATLRYPEGVVLFSSTNPVRVRQNAGVLDRGEFVPEQAQALQQLLAALAPAEA